MTINGYSSSQPSKPKENHLSDEFLQDSSDASAVIDGLQTFGKRTQGNDEYTTEDEDRVSKKRVRIRVPVVRSRSAREHALTVVRRRPLVPYSRLSPVEPIEATLLPTPRKIVTRTKVRNYDAYDVEKDSGVDHPIPNELFTNTNRHKITVTRRRKIKPTPTVSTTHRERITRKKLVNVRPIPEPSSTLAIITTGFYTVPTIEDDDEYYDSDYSKISTPELYTSFPIERNPITTEPIEIKASVLDVQKTSTSSDPIIITDNFFFPEIYEETTTTENKYDLDDETTTNLNEFIDSTTPSEKEIENVSDKSANKETTTEKENETTVPTVEDITDATLPSLNDDEESTTLAESEELINISMIELDSNNTTQTIENDMTTLSSDLPLLDNSPTQKLTETSTTNIEDNLRVIPIASNSEIQASLMPTTIQRKDVISQTTNVFESNLDLVSSEIPTVIPLESKLTFDKESDEMKTKAVTPLNSPVTTSIPSLTPEDIEAGLTDDLYLSLSRPDFPQIIPSKAEVDENPSSTSESNQATPELQTSVYYTETIVTSTRLRTYTYVVTKLNGQETEVTSSTTVRPRVTTLTLTVPVTVTVTPTMVLSPSVLSSSLEHSKSNEEAEDEGRKFNLATRVMSNGVEVIVAGTTPAYRWDNSNPQPTLTLSEAVVMMLPQDKPNEFVTKTCTTTFTYLNTITRDGITIVSTDQQVIANTATEERHRKPGTEAASVTLEASPTLQTEVFKTTYTYLTLNTDHPDERNALESSTRVIANTVTAPQYYLDMILEPSEVPRPETNTYLSTRLLQKTFVEDGKTKVEKANDIITQLIITESALPPRSTSVMRTLTALDESISSTDIAKTHYITYTYYNTYLEKGSKVVKTNVATSSDIIYEKAPVRKTAATPEPIQIFATKTYLTTFTFFTTLLQAAADGEIATIVSSRTQIEENIVTESIAPSLLDAGYMNALLTTSHHSDTLKNVVTGSTIIFFDDEEEVTPTTTSAFNTLATASVDKVDNHENSSTSQITDAVGSETNEVTSKPVEPDSPYNEEEAGEESTDPPPNKKPSQVSNLLSLGSLGINSLSALGPVITAMAGLLQGKTSATRRNDTEVVTEPPVPTTTQRSPIYIPVAEFAEGDIETAESQNIALHLANSNHLPETRHKVTSNLADGIPISPGEVITANSDVIIGKPGKLGPRPPQTLINDEHIGMKPPPVPVPNIPVHPVLEVAESESPKQPIKIQKGSQQLEIYPAHQIYEEHIKVPIVLNQPTISNRPQNVHQSFHNTVPKRISSKQDILENDPLLIPPSIISNVNADLKNRNLEKNRRPWSPKDPLSAPNILNEDKNRLNFIHKEFAQSENNGGIDRSKKKSHVPEPIVHQVPHVIDRGTGQPLLVNIQPSQVANVVIPQGGTQALIFGDTNEPHISGQYFDDPSPYPEPEVGPGFVGIDKVENLPQYSKNDNPADYMTPPNLPSNVKISQNPNLGNRQHIPLSKIPDFKQHINSMSRPEQIPIWHHDNSNLAAGQGHVHTEILVHHGTDTGHLRPQSRPTIPTRNYSSLPPRREHTNIHIPSEQTPPRRTEVTAPTENAFYDQLNNPATNTNWKNEKKPLRNSQARWPRPTSRPRLPPRITGRPYGRPTRIERPTSPHRPPLQHPQRVPTNIYHQNEFNKINQQPASSSLLNSNQQIYASGVRDQADPKDKIIYYNQENNSNGNFQENKNHSMNHGSFISEDHFSTSESDHKKPLSYNESHGGTTYTDKTIDSDFDASENVKVTSDTQENLSEEDIIIDSEKTNYESTVDFNPNKYFASNNSNDSDNIAVVVKPLNYSDLTKINNQEEGDIIIGSEKKQDHYLFQSTSSELGGPYNGHNGHSIFVTNTNIQSERNPVHQHDIIDLKPPAIIPVFEPNGHSRPYSKPHFVFSNSESKPDIITESPESSHNILHGHIRPGIGQILDAHNEKTDLETKLNTQKNETQSHSYRGRPRPEYSQTHSGHPQIITKPKPHVPRPVVVSSGKVKKPNNYKRPSVQFSLPIDSTGEENESKTQTERPPSVNTVKNTKSKEESLHTAFQTNFAATDTESDKESGVESDQKSSNTELKKITASKNKELNQDMVPPPVSAADNNKETIKSQSMDEGLKPPPSPTDVLGLSPPPLDRTTTGNPLENKVNHQKINSDVSGMKPPPLYIPLKESNMTPPLPSENMIPPNPRPSVVRPYLADILSQDMIPPPVDITTTRSLEIATVRPGVAVSGSIQIATAVATSHIPVMQDMESKIPIVHGTVDLPVVVDVPEFLKPIDTKRADHVSVYTVRPFETRQRNTVKPSIAPSPSSTVVFRQSQVHKEQQNSHNHKILSPTRPSSPQILRKPSKLPEFSIVLEPSTDIHLPSIRIEPTESLSINNINKKTKQKDTLEVVTKVHDIENSQPFKMYDKTNNTHSQEMTDLKIHQSASKMMEIIGTVVHEFIQNSTNERVEMKPQEVTRYETLTVTRTETSVLGFPPTTRTLLITHTLTSTRVETVTETLLRPTSVISTITSTILQSATRIPAYESGNENESIFVVMSDQKPPAPGAEEVEAEYGEDDISRDEQDISGNEIHRVLSGGILGAPSVPIRPPKVQCVPECKAFKSEMCAESAGEMRCICRPGFARMFPDRPCKPTYTFTVSVGLDRLGRDKFMYNTEINDTTSAIFRRYAHPIKEALDRTLMQSDLRDAYRGLNIAKFLSDPARVLFHVQLSSNTDEAKLKEVIRKYLVLSNYSLGGTEVYASKDLGMVEAHDFDECTTENGGPHHDCSPNAACFNLKGSYQCSCKESWADLSENPAYPGRICSQAPLGCASCNNKGHCLLNSHGQEVCECFPWHSGQKCQVNLKVLLIALVTTGAILLGLLAVCVGMACFRNPSRRRTSADRRAMISGNGGDTSSEGSITELAIPHHVPHILPPPPQMVAPAPPLKKAVKKVSGKPRRAPRKPAPTLAPVPANSCPTNDQRDRSLTVMIPRAKYRSAPQSVTPQNYKSMSSFAVDEHKLIDYLEGGAHPGHRKPSLVSNSDYKESEVRLTKQQQQQQQQQQPGFGPSGALVSAGFQVSATVTRTMDAESTLARSCGETTLEPSTKVVRADFNHQELESTLVRSCAETTIQASTKQMMRLDLVEAGSTLARSCGETTIQPPTKMAERKERDARDSASEGHTMAERDLGSTLRLPAQHAPLYNQDRTSSDRESSFDSL